MKLTEEHKDCDCHEMLEKTDVCMPEKCHIIHEDTLDIHDMYQDKAEKWDMECNLSCSNGTSTEYATRLEKETMEQSFKITDLEQENNQLKEDLMLSKNLCDRVGRSQFKLKQKQDQIIYATLHAGCTVRLPDCIMCKIQEILKGKK